MKNHIDPNFDENFKDASIEVETLAKNGDLGSLINRYHDLKGPKQNAYVIALISQLMISKSMERKTL